MKWAALLAGAALVYPLGVWLRGARAVRLHLWTLIGVLPFTGDLDHAFHGFGAFPGDTHGFEFTLIDCLALALLFAETRRARPLPYRPALAAYLLAVLVAAALAQWPLGAFGYAWKLLRMYFLFWVVWRAGHDRAVPAALLKGVVAGIVYEGALTAWQHFGQGIHQANGTFLHQNTLGILLNLVVMAPLALVFAGSAAWWMALAPLAALAASLFTVSRGSLLFLGTGSALVLLGSTVRRPTARKLRFGLLGIVMAVVVGSMAISRLETRTAAERAGSMQVRETYERAAALMLREHPLGVGPNHFILMLLTSGYGDRARVDWTQRTGIVHNVYWLTAAETGYAGLLALVALFAAPLVTALRQGLRSRGDPRGDMLLGLGAGLTVFYAHSFFEWAWRQTEVSYAYWTCVAMVAVLARQLRDEARRARAARLARGAPGPAPGRGGGRTAGAGPSPRPRVPGPVAAT